MHTPGPWTLTAGGRRIVDGKTELVTVVGSYRSSDEEQANARLIAAAPELLEALRAIVMSSDYGSPSDGDDNRPLMRAARAAIAKAEGKNS